MKLLVRAAWNLELDNPDGECSKLNVSTLQLGLFKNNHFPLKVSHRKQRYRLSSNVETFFVKM